MIVPINNYISVEILKDSKARVVALPDVGEYSRLSLNFLEGDTIAIRPDTEIISIEDESFIQLSDVIGVVKSPPYRGD